MPANLPGFYFDEQRNRYFPISSRGAPSVRAPPGKPASTVPSRPIVKKGRHNSVQYYIREATAGVYAPQQAKTFRQMQEAQVARTRCTDRITAPWDWQWNHFTALDVSDKYILIGQKSGLLYRRGKAPDDVWEPLNHTESQIIGVKLYDHQYLAASFGPRPQIIIGNEEYATSLNLNFFHDIWTVGWSNEGPSDIVLGMKNQAVHIPSLESLRGMKMFATKSDVFAVHRHGAQLFAGARNGSVRVFDIRAPPEQGTNLWGPQARTARSASGRFPATKDDGHQSAVTNLSVVQQWKLILNAMDGSLGVYDMRFTTNGAPNPILRLSGHVNSCTQPLGFTITPDANIVFAAGEDMNLRAWSLSTGEQLQPPARDNEVLLGKAFDEHVRAIRLYGSRLYAISGRDIWGCNVPFP